MRRIRTLLWVSLLSIVLTVALGAYWFGKIVHELGGDVRQQSEQLLEIEAALSDAVIAMSGQTQEWKDLLLRAHDPAALTRHKQGFELQKNQLAAALQRAEELMLAAGLDASNIRAMRQRHQVLQDDYATAYSRLDGQPLSYREADKLVIGKDRQLRDDLLHLKLEVETQADARVAQLGIVDTERSTQRYYLLGILGVSLPLVSFLLFYLVYHNLRSIGRDDARIRTIYEAIGDAVVVTDTQGKIESLNEVAQQMTGWTQQQAQGQALRAVMTVFDAAGQKSVETPVESVLRDGCMVPMSNGMLLRSRDGNEYHIEDSAAPVLDEQGKMVAVVMVFHNVSQRYNMLRRVREERALFRQTFEQAAVGMAHVAPDGTWLRVNHKLCDIVGYSESELLNLTFQDITHADDLATDVGHVQAMLAGDIDHYCMEKRYIRKDGAIIWVNLTVALARKEDGSPDYFISVVEDIQARKDAEMTAAIARQQYQALFEQMPEGVLLIDKEMRVVSYNNEALLQLEYSPDELLKLHVWDIDMVDDETLVQQRAQKMRDTGGDEFESQYRTHGGRLLDVLVSVRLARLPNGAEVFQCLFRDISEQKESARQIEHLAYHDQLTGLANRRLLGDRMTQAISSVLRRDAHIAVLYLDLDHFKDINDSLGHQFGDAMLKIVAMRLHDTIRAEDTLARIGGDEFVVMLNDVETSEDAAVIAQKVIQNIALPMHIDGEEVQVTPSIGIGICPQDGSDSETLLKNADAAMYLAKQQGRSTYRFCTEELHTRSIERLQIERLLRKAIERNEFELYYQPKVNLNDGLIIGCEALIRWNHPGMGLIAPQKFIPVAEQSHLINEIGIWVLRAACHQAAQWQQRGFDLQVAFNVSARQFMRPQELLQALRAAISESGVDPDGIEIEMTESLLIDEHSMSDVLQQIRAMGIHLALDDFGTGYSSLSYLRRFPISILKIDRSFVSDADRDPDDAEMVKTIIGMANNLRMNLVAEGIETEGQRKLLCIYGCETGQGYHFSRPLPLADFEALVVRQKNKNS